MNLKKNNFTSISVLIALIFAGPWQEVQSQGLKLQNIAPPSSGAGSNSSASGVSGVQSGGGPAKTGLRTDIQSDFKPDEALLKGATGGVSASELDYSDFIVAIVDSEPITNREVSQRAQEHMEQIKKQGAPLPPREIVLSKTLEELILEKAQLQLAIETGINVLDEEVLQAQNSIAESNGLTLDQLYSQIKRQGQSVEQYKVRVRQQMILQKLRDREVISKIRISDLEADQFLQEQGKKGSASTQLINLSQILIAVPEGLSEADQAPYQAKAQDLIQKIKNGADFAELARSNSEALDSKTGGVMGLKPMERYPTLFINAVRAAKVGQVVGPIKSGAGLHILKVTDKQQGEGETSFVTQTHARHILLKPGGQLSQNAARAQLAEFKRRIEKGDIDFAELAKEYSQDASASAGGDLGWSSPGQFVPEFEAVLSKLAPGQIADPLVSRFGVHLIQLLERKQAPITQNDRREAAKKIMREKKFEETYNNWVREVRGHAFIEYRDAPL